MPLLGDFGDHLQLPPVPKKNSMLAPLEGTSQEHRVGASIFRQARYVFQSQQLMRFNDPVLIQILNTMRTVGGQVLSDSDWQALCSTELDDDSASAAKPDRSNADKNDDNATAARLLPREEDTQGASSSAAQPASSVEQGS